MKKIELTKEEQEQVDKYNACRKINSFFYNNEDSHQMFKERYSRESEFGPIMPDRSDFITIKNMISNYLTTLLERFHKQPCLVRGRDGIIIVARRKEVENTSPYTVPFRRDHSTSSDTEYPAFWVEVLNEDGSRNNFHSHLYLIHEIELV